MTKIHKDSDLIIQVVFYDEQDNPIPVPEFDFILEYYQPPSHKYNIISGRKNGDLFNCVQVDDKLIITADKPGFLASSQPVRLRRTYYIPDISFPDGIHKIVNCFDTDIIIVSCNADETKVSSDQYLDLTTAIALVNAKIEIVNTWEEQESIRVSNEQARKEAELYSNDYKLFKFVEEILAELGYVLPEKAEREAARAEINNMEAEIADLKQQIENYVEPKSEGIV